MPYECKVVEKEAQSVLSIRTRSAVKDLPEVLGKAYGKIFNYITQLHEEPSGPPFVAYYNMDMDDLDIEIGFPVNIPLPPSQDIKCSEILAGDYLETMYKGAYNNIEAAYNDLMKYMDDNNLQWDGVSYEFYLNDPAKTPPEELQTDILISLK